MDRPNSQSRYGARRQYKPMEWLQNLVLPRHQSSPQFGRLRVRSLQSHPMPLGSLQKTNSGTAPANRRSRSSLKNRASQIEPWLLAVSPSLASFSAKRIVALYAGRMQIEQTFRDIKNPQWGLGLSDSQTRKRPRMAILLLLGALATYALWLIGLAAAQGGYRVQYGSKAKAATTLSIISLAQLWISEKNGCPAPSKLASAIQTLTDLVRKL